MVYEGEEMNLEEEMKRDEIVGGNGNIKWILSEKEEFGVKMKKNGEELRDGWRSWK